MTGTPLIRWRCSSRTTSWTLAWGEVVYTLRVIRSLARIWHAPLSAGQWLSILAVEIRTNRGYLYINSNIYMIFWVDKRQSQYTRETCASRRFHRRYQAGQRLPGIAEENDGSGIVE